MQNTTQVDQIEIASFGDKDARWFQVQGRNEVRKALSEGFRRICIIQPTGTGKTITSGVILIDGVIRELIGVPSDRAMRVLFISHRHRLLTQAQDVYAVEEGIEIIPHSMMSRLPEDIEFDLVVVDECHHEATLSFQLQLERISKAPLIGLTADNDRNDSRLCKFDKIIELISREQAVKEGYLAETDICTFVDSPTRSQVELALDIIDLKQKEMGQIMAFARTKTEGQQLLEGIRARGLSAELLVDVSEEKLNEMLSQFERKEYQFAISCMKLGEGVDVKGCEGVLIARTVKSKPLLNQIIGRAARPDTDCAVYEIINPLATDNISASDIVKNPRNHTFHYKVRGQWRQHRLI